MKKILITGATGFVGQHIVNLLNKDYSIIGLSIQKQTINTPSFEFIKGDILDPDTLYKVFNEYFPDTILHLAAIARTWTADPEEVFKVNLIGTLNIYKTVAKLKQEKKYSPKIIYVSSAEVYGKTSTPEDVDEEAILNPVNYYAVSKVAADRLSYQYSQSHKLNIIILRPFNHAGPGQAKGFFVPDMASQIVELEKNPTNNKLLVGNLDALRDFLDVRDVANAYKLVIEKENITPGDVFNISSGKGLQIKEVLDLLLKNAHKKLEVVEDPKKLRAAEIPVLIGNNQKFSRYFNWKPEYPFEETIKDVLNYWRNKRD